MAVVQISRIQHRSGVSDNLPQLARGELGLAVDTRKIYIGNGGSDAPQTENIEILTSLSSLIESSDSYTYSDAQIGFSAQTGASANSPITRTLQNKLDDFASVRDFGAVGDGATDDTAAINRALYELFAREQITRVRRALYFPAGTYKVTSTINIPTYAKLVGEGPDSSIIQGSLTAGSTPVAQTADSLQQTGASVGTGGATRPADIVIESMTFSATTQTPVFLVDQADNILLSNTNFIGPLTATPSTIGDSNYCIKITSSATYTTNHVTFFNCNMENAYLGVVADNDMDNIVFNACHFQTMFKGFKIGEFVTGSAPSVDGPRGMKVISSLFDNIYSNAIHVYDGTGFSSAFNYYQDCGNNGSGSGSATAHVINYAVGNSHSIGDYFDRPDSDDTNTTRRVNVDAAHLAGMAFDNTQGVKFGGYIRGYGQSVTLDNNAVKSTGISFPDNAQEAAIEIDYYIDRNSKLRQGTLRITHDGTAQIIDDSFNENNGSTGVTFSLTNGSNITTLNYTTDNQTSGTLYYSIRTLR
jgi:polygalacturonase